MSIDLTDGITEDTDLGYVDDTIEDSLDIGLITASVTRINDLGADLTVYYTQSTEPSVLDLIFLYTGSIFSKVSNFDSEYNYINTNDIPGVNLYRVGYENLYWSTIQQKYIHPVLITINPTPSYARVVFTVNGEEYAQNSIYVDRGSIIRYTVTADTYRTVTDTITCEQDQTIDVVMVVDVYQPYLNEVLVNLTGSTKFESETIYPAGVYRVELAPGLDSDTTTSTSTSGYYANKTVNMDYVETITQPFIIRAYCGSDAINASTPGTNPYTGPFKVNAVNINNGTSTTPGIDVNHIFGAGGANCFTQSRSGGMIPITTSVHYSGGANCLGDGDVVVYREFDTSVVPSRYDASGAGSCCHFIPVGGVFGTDYLRAYHAAPLCGAGGAYGGGGIPAANGLGNTGAGWTTRGGNSPAGNGSTTPTVPGEGPGAGGYRYQYNNTSTYYLCGAGAYFNGTTWENAPGTIVSKLNGVVAPSSYIRVTYLGPYAENDILYSSSTPGDHVYTPSISCRAKIVAIGGSGSGGNDTDNGRHGGCGGKGDIASVIVNLTENVPINIHVGDAGQLKADGGNGGTGGSGSNYGANGGGAGGPTIVSDSSDHLIVFANPGAGGGGAGGRSTYAGGSGGGGGGGFRMITQESARDLTLWVYYGDSTILAPANEYSETTNMVKYATIPAGSTFTVGQVIDTKPITPSEVVNCKLVVESINQGSITFASYVVGSPDVKEAEYTAINYYELKRTPHIEIGENTRDIYLYLELLSGQSQFSLHEITESQYNTLISDIGTESRCFYLPAGTTLSGFTQTKQFQDTSVMIVQDTLSVTSISGSSVVFSGIETLNGGQIWNTSTLEIQDVVATTVIPSQLDEINIPGANGGNADSGAGANGNIAMFPDLHGGKADGGWNTGDPGHAAYGGGGNGGTGGGAGGGAGERNNEGLGGAGGGGAGGDNDAGGGSVGQTTGSYHSFTDASNVKTVPTDVVSRNAEYGVSGYQGMGGLPDTTGNPGYVQITFLSYTSN